MEILWEDRHLVLCVKPAGVLSESGGMPELLEQATGRGPIYCVHRLDRAVGGVMVYAKTKPAAAALSAQVSGRAVTKEYLAVVRGVPEAPEGQLRDLLFKDARAGKAYVVRRPRKGVKEAILHYRVEAVADNGGQPVSLVRVRLETGRFHQIRAQFAARKLPLLGDGKYGGSDNRCGVALWSARLALTHPVTGTPLEAACPPPQQYPWNLFS